MNTPKDGGPAFPASLDFDHTGNCANSHATLSGGMSLRDWFAGMAMQAMLSNPECVELCADANLVTLTAYQAADAMLAEREKGQAK